MADKSLGVRVFEKIKSDVAYDEQLHCPMIINLFDDNKGVTEFCVEVGISRRKFTRWQAQCERFKEAVSIAKEVGIMAWHRMKDEWVEEDQGKFCFTAWQMLYKKNFGPSTKVALAVNPKSNPIEQYIQIMEQSAGGDFTSAEIKQIMESINIGLRAHEVCNLQNEINELKEGLKKMEERELEHQIATAPAPKENQVALDS